MICIGKARASSARRTPTPPRPRITSVFPVRLWAREDEKWPFHCPARKWCSLIEKWRKADITRYRAAVAVTSSIAIGVLETMIPVDKNGEPTRHRGLGVRRDKNGFDLLFFFARADINLILASTNL